MSALANLSAVVVAPLVDPGSTLTPARGELSAGLIEGRKPGVASRQVRSKDLEVEGHRASRRRPDLGRCLKSQRWPEGSPETQQDWDLRSLRENRLKRYRPLNRE